MRKSKFLFLLFCLFTALALTACQVNLPGITDDGNTDDTPNGDVNTDDSNDDQGGNDSADHVHEYVWTIKQSVKCNVDGIEEGVCECGETTTRTIKSEGHKFVVDEAVEATCENTGLTEGKHCEKCGFVEVEQRIIPEAHEAVVDEAVEPTCTEAGKTEGSHCGLCGDVLVAQKEVPASHTEEEIPGKDATCTEPGLTAGVKCSVCGEVLEAQEEIPAGHVEEEIPGKDATCTEPGLTAGKKCGLCGEVLEAQQEIPASGHTEEEIPAEDATCTEPGLTAGKKCSVCDEVVVAQEEVPASGHTEGEAASFENAQTCTVCGEVLVAQIRDITVYYYNTEWTKVDIYAWNADGVTILGSWPGVATEAATDLGEGWYSYSIVDKDLAGLNILFHNKVLIEGSDGMYEGQQTADIAVEPGKYFYYGKGANGYATKEEALAAYELEQTLPEPEGTTLYLKPNSNWTQGNARFAVYTWDGGDQWFDMEAVGDGTYKVVIPADIVNIIFCRMDPAKTANGWSNKWNQTGDLKVQTNGYNLYTVEENTWDKGGGTWSTVE